MKLHAHNYLNEAVKHAEATNRLSGILVMSETVCCLCCRYGTGGNLFCK